jgi:fatty-acyl-CoA synthase
MTIAIDWLEKRAQLSPNRIAIVDRVDDIGREVDFRQLNAQGNQTARFLRDALHMKKGDLIAVLSTNCIAYLDILFACNKTGAILQTLNWRLAVPELEKLLNDCQPGALVYSTEFAEVVRKLKQRRAVSIGRYVALGEKAQDADLAFKERDGFGATTPEAPPIEMGDPWLLCYTGGTTGLPKPAIHTYANVVANAVNTLISWELDADDCAILNAPLFHSGGLHVFTTPLLYAGGTSILCKTFDVDQTFDLIEEGRANLFFGVPTMHQLLQESPRWERAPIARMKLVINGGARCPMPVFEKYWAKDVDFKTGYGMTEAGPNTFWLPKHLVRAKPGSVGVTLMHVEAKLLAQDGRDIARANTVGELLIRGPHRTPGYFNNPKETAGAIDSDGWLHSGDLAYRDEDGCYYIAGRKKEMFKSGGENVYPLEVEAVLYGHPAIRDAAVFGVPSARWGEVGRAVVTLKPGRSATEKELIAWTREQLAPFKAPHRVYFTKEFPTTAAGKIAKEALRAEFGALDPEGP